MNTYIYLVRHAQSAYSPDEMGRGLTEKGLADAKMVTEILMYDEIDIVFSSPYRRAVQTVEGIAKQIGVSIHTEEKFKERILGSKSVTNFEEAINKLWSDIYFSFEGGESNVIAQKRGIAALQEILNSYKGKKIVVGTHGNIMTLIMNYFDEQYNFEFWKQLTMPDIYKLTFGDKHFVNAERIYK